MGSRIRVSSGFCLMGVLGLLVLPLRWAMGAFLAALVHELLHYLAVLACGGQVLELTLESSGARIETTPLTAIEEALCALAGPLGSFSMLLMAEHFPEAALCGLIQGAYNLLPLYPLDGGRVLKCLLPETVYFGLQVFSLVFLSGVSLWIMTYSAQIGTIFLLSLWIPVIQRKKSCKAA